MMDVVVFGAGGHARVVIDVLEKHGEYRVAAVIAAEGEVEGYPVLRSLQETDMAQGVVAVGDNWTRARLVSEIVEARPDFRFVTPVHPSAQLGRDVTLGPGTVVMAGACINPGTRVGGHCIVNTRASLDHDNVLGDYASVAPGVTTGGNVVVGRYAALGIGAVCAHGLHVGEHAVVGAGAVVVENVPPRVVAYGLPCRVVRSREPGERYL